MVRHLRSPTPGVQSLRHLLCHLTRAYLGSEGLIVGFLGSSQVVHTLLLVTVTAKEKGHFPLSLQGELGRDLLLL